WRLIIGIQDLGDVLRNHVFQDGSIVVPHVERLEVERLRRLRLPQAEQVDCVDAIAQHGRVKRGSPDNAIGTPADPMLAILVVTFCPAAELDVENDLRPRDFPRVSQAQPLVGEFHLPPIPQRLVEDSKLVTNAVPDARDSQRGHRVEETSCQTAKPAVATTRWPRWESRASG